MAVNDLQCPNCGAPVEFAGKSQVTCPFCQSQLYFTPDGIKVESALNEALEGQPTVVFTAQTLTSSSGSYQVDLDAITALVNQGKKIDAIKLYREQTGVGLKDAKDAVEAIGRGEMPVVTIDQRHGTQAASPTHRASGWLGCLPILLFVGLCAGFVMLSSQVGFRVWGPLDQVMKILGTDPQVTQVFGQPLSLGPMITGSISGGDTSSSTHFSVPLYGPRHSGTLNVSGSWRRGVWDISIYLTYDDADGEEQAIYITQKVK